ncbi:MAG TPA: GEVED domain-containing protein [Bacteroidales bacterium]|nr:GEVED domain-containing protein [Bacteroidales bacterium]
MKKLFTLFLLLFAWAISSWGQAPVTVTIGSGTTTGRYPLDDYFVYSRSQCIYLASEIGAGGTITKLRWYRSDTGADPDAIDSTRIWLTETSNNVLPDGNWENPGTLVAVIANIDLGSGDGWYEIDITDFVYSGTQNLLVSVHTQDAPYTAPHSYWRYTATTGNLSRLGQSDYTNPPAMSLSVNRPNIQLDMLVSTPVLSVSPAALAFGYIPYPGSSAGQTYTLSGINLTSSPVVVTAPAGFEVSLDSSTWSGSADVAFTPPTLSDTTIYVRFTPAAALTSYSDVVINDGNGASASVTVSGTSDVFTAYCLSGASYTADEDITHVGFGNILNNTSACASLTGSQGTATGTASLYSNFVSNPPTSVSRGITYPINVEITQCGNGVYGHDVRVYIDFNQNGLLTDTGEEFIIWPYNDTSTHTITANIAIPATASLGSTLMRIVCKESSTNGPCLVSSWGETEDYKITIQEYTTCAAPSDLTVTNVTTQSADLGWNANGTTVWQVEWDTSGFAQGTGHFIDPATNTQPITGLIPNTEYDFYVRALCDPDTSYWSGPYTFSTLLCNASNQCTYEFTLSDIYGDGWNGGTMQVLQGGNVIATLSLLNGDSATQYVSICDGYSFEVYWNNGGSFPGECGLRVFDPFGSQLFYQAPLNDTLVGTTLFTEDGNCTPPSCYSPSGQTVTNPTAVGADLGWTSADSFFDIYISTAAAPAPGAATVPTVDNAPGNSYTWTGGNSATTYFWWVRADCEAGGGTGQSYWYGPYSFNTVLCDSSSQCEYTFNMFDSYGDGWNGAEMQVLQNGIVVAALNLASGDSGTMMVPVCEGINLEVLWNIGGSYPGECGLQILDPFGIELYNQNPVGSTFVGTTLYTGTGNCQPPLCPAPTAQTVNNIALDSAELAWTTGGATMWNIEYGPYGFTPGTGTLIHNVTNPYVLSGLSSATMYDWYVQDSCDVDVVSLWTGPHSFTTLCPTVTTFPFTEDFEAGLVPPVCWSEIVNNTIANWEYGFTTTGFANVLYDYSQNEWLMTPVLDLSSLTHPYLSFDWMMSYYWGVDPYNNYDLICKISTDGGITWDSAWSEAAEGMFNSWQWYTKPIDLLAYAGESNVKIAWQYIGDDGAQAAIDNIVVNEIPAPAITSLGSTSGCPGSSLVINGTNLIGVSLVTIGGTPATITANTPASVTVTVGSGTTGIVEVTAFGGTATSTETFTVNTLPQAFSVIGGGSYCEDGSGVVITLESSENGTEYSLSTTPVTTLTGNGGAVTFGPEPFAPGVYTITAENPLTGCTSVMSGSAIVSVNPKPDSITATASDDTICQGTSIDLNVSALTNSGSLFTYNEGFETWPPAGFTFINNNGTGNSWEPSVTYYSGSFGMYYPYTAASAADAWAITPAQSLVAGTTYTVSFWYRIASSMYPEKLKVTVGTDTLVAAQTTTLWDNNGDTALLNTTWAFGTAIYTPATSGNYYFGFNCYSDADMYNLYIDEISIKDPPIPSNYSWTSIPSGFISSVQNPAGVTPDVTTRYIVSVENSYGCSDTASVTVVVNTCGGYAITGKTKYAPKANNGSPAPNPPTYNAAIYNIDNVIVILKNALGAELARDTSDALGNYQFTNVADGSYILSYDKYTVDTMQWANDVNAIDLAIIKYYVGTDTLSDPSRNFSAKYKKAANVDNNTSINSIDLSRIKTKIGSPLNASKNFPKGNWVALDTAVTVAGANLNITLKTICYGDYNASSTKYRDSLVNWSGVKSMPSEIIVTSDEYITTSDPSYFEVPLRISTKINEFSAMGLELNYPDKDFRLISVSMPNTSNKNGVVKINPTLEEVIAEDNDLLVTDEDGVIRVVYATTNHYDVATNDQMIILGFVPVHTLAHGEVEFSLSGTGVLGDQYGIENEDAYLIMPKVYVQGTEAGFEFSGYPNPFSGQATLNYNIPENGNVKLTVYNAIGELVNELVNESQMSGKHAVEFSPKSLPAGMYTFKLEFEGQNISKCLVLKLVH